MDVKDIIRNVKRVEIRARKKTDAYLMGQYHSLFKGQGMTFSEVRQYQVGDDIRRIDWNKTARFQTPFVKEMEEERELTIMLLVDISASMDYASRTALKREFVAEICAGLGFSAVANNDKVGMVLFADKVYKVIPPQKGRRHVLAMISQLLSAKPIPSPTGMAGVLRYMTNVFKKKSLLFLFSDFNDDFDSKIFKITAKKHQFVGVRIYDDRDNEIPDVGYAEFQDAETEQRIWVDTRSTRFRYDFMKHQKYKIRLIQEVFEQSSAHFLNLNTGGDYVREFHKIFRK